MAYSKKQAAFVGYLDVPLSGEDLAAIVSEKNEIDTHITEILAYATPKKLDFKLQWDDENDRWKASLYQTDPRDEWAGIGLRATGDQIEIAVSALACKLTIVGKRDWLTLVRTTGATTNGIS